MLGRLFFVKGVKMKEELNQILKEGAQDISSANDLKSLDEIRVRYLGKTGKLTQILR